MGKRLTELHPTTQKLRQVEALMADLGVSIRYDGYGKYTFVDNGEEYHYRDNDGGVVSAFPSFYETKLTIDD